MGIDHATTHADFLADALHPWLNEAISWEVAMSDYHNQARVWSEKAYRRTSTFAVDLRPMTRAALQRRGLVRSPSGMIKRALPGVSWRRSSGSWAAFS